MSEVRVLDYWDEVVGLLDINYDLNQLIFEKCIIQLYGVDLTKHRLECYIGSHISLLRAREKIIREF